MPQSSTREERVPSIGLSQALTHGPAWAAALAAALAVVVPLGPLAPSAAAADDHDPEHEALDKEASDTIDIAIIAGDHAWTIEATRRHMRDQNEFGALQVQIESEYPATFAGAEFAKAPGGRSWLRFKGPVPQNARALAAASGLDVGLSGGRRFSSIELAERAEAVVKFYVNAGYRPVSAEVLPSGVIQAAATGAKQPGLELPPALSEGVDVTLTDRQAGGELHGYGGAKTRSSTGQCTTGFSVRSLLTDETGVTTAAHCNAMTFYEEPWTTNYNIQFPFQDQHLGINGDVEWHTTVGHVNLAEYYADSSPSARREVNSVETSAATNNLYCLYSRMGGFRTCDRVRSTFVTLFTTGLASNLVGMDEYNASPGDSGGPWSYGTEAVGSVVGWYWVPFGNHDAWSRAWLFDSAIDVEVLTQ